MKDALLLFSCVNVFQVRIFSSDVCTSNRHWLLSVVEPMPLIKLSVKAKIAPISWRLQLVHFRTENRELDATINDEVIVHPCDQA